MNWIKKLKWKWIKKEVKKRLAEERTLNIETSDRPLRVFRVCDTAGEIHTIHAHSWTQTMKCKWLCFWKHQPDGSNGLVFTIANENTRYTEGLGKLPDAET